MRRITVLITALLLALGLLAAPAAADHDHNLNNPSGCVTIKVGHQDHGPNDPGRKFHGSAHVGTAVEYYGFDDHGVTADPHDEFGEHIGILGQGHSPVWVGGSGC